MRRRRGHEVALAVLAATAAGIALAAPEAAASSGIFLYFDATTGLPTTMFAPPEMSCIAAAGKGAYNFTGSDVILYYDNECEHYLLVLVPWETLNMPFNSIGFVPSGGRTPPPAQLPTR